MNIWDVPDIDTFYPEEDDVGLTDEEEAVEEILARLDEDEEVKRLIKDKVEEESDLWD